jgi:hypothetical protein
MTRKAKPAAKRAPWGSIKARITALAVGESITVTGAHAAAALTVNAHRLAVGLSQRDLSRTSPRGIPLGTPRPGPPPRQRVFILTRIR